MHLNPIGAKIFITNLVKELSLVPVPPLGLNCKLPAAQHSVDIKNPSSNKKLGSLSNANNKQDRVERLASWWLAKTFLQKQSRLMLSYMGDSQLGPIQGADAYSFDRLVDATGNHQSYVMEQDFKIFAPKTTRFEWVGCRDRYLDQLIISGDFFKSI